MTLSQSTYSVSVWFHWLRLCWCWRMVSRHGIDHFMINCLFSGFNWEGASGRPWKFSYAIKPALFLCFGGDMFKCYYYYFQALDWTSWGTKRPRCLQLISATAKSVSALTFVLVTFVPGCALNVRYWVSLLCTALPVMVQLLRLKNLPVESSG